MEDTFTQNDEFLELGMFGEHAEKGVKNLNRHQTAFIYHKYPHI